MVSPYSHSPILPFTGALEGSKAGTEATEDRNREGEGGGEGEGDKEGEGEGEGGGEGEGEVVESSVAQPEDTPTSEVAVATNKESEGSETTPTEDPPVATETVDMTKDRPLQRSKSLNFIINSDFQIRYCEL